MGPKTETEYPTETETYSDDLKLDQEVDVTSDDKHATNQRPPLQIVWRNVFLIGSLHLASIYGLWLIPQAKLLTLLWAFLMAILGGFGITVGAHRLWSHRSFKARLPLRILLAVLNSIALENDIIEWSRDHRAHHKFSETDADPHNAKRGFFFAHVGWLLVRKHPDVKAKGKQLDLSDLYADPVCRIQKKYYVHSVILMCFIVPTIVPVYCWGESRLIAFFIPVLLRYCFSLNVTWLVNSAAHLWGSKPYDTRINPSQNSFVNFFTTGEGNHNYHHTFPQDYSSSETDWFLNCPTMFIDAFEKLGQVYDKKKIPQRLVEQRRKRTGDLSASKDN